MIKGRVKALIKSAGKRKKLTAAAVTVIVLAAAAAAAPQMDRNERRVILRILMISSISSPCSQQDAALRADIVSGSNEVRFTLVKYITESLAKQSTFTRKRPLLSIQVNLSIDYFELLFRFF